MRNINNSEKDRLSRIVSRRNTQAHRRWAHNVIDDDIDEVRSRIAATADTQKDLKAQLKDLTEKKKESGRTPRHNRAAAQKFDGVQIPTIHGLGGSTSTPHLGQTGAHELEDPCQFYRSVIEKFEYLHVTISPTASSTPWFPSTGN